jgi:TonB family protein
MGVPLPPPPPPIISIDDRSRPTLSSQLEAVTFAPGEVRCDGEPIKAVRLETPFPTSLRRFGQRSIVAPVYRLSFSVDAQGRAHGIRRIWQDAFPAPSIDTNDLSPALAASRFAPGAPHEKCEIGYTAQLTALDAAPISLLYELASTTVSNAAFPEIYDRLREPDADCKRGPTSPRTLNYPAFETIDQPAGTRSWTFLSFDVDAKGRTTNVRVLGSSGNGALDRAGVKAVAANLYAPGGARRGCTFHFYRSGNGTLPSPALPADAPTDNGELSACAIDPKTIASLLNGNAYPVAFSRRRIEGIAVIGYDTAPWGATGNVKVITAEPDEAFGQAALGAIYGAKVAESATGYRGCVRRIHFVLPPAPGENRSPNQGG